MASRRTPKRKSLLLAVLAVAGVQTALRLQGKKRDLNKFMGKLQEDILQQFRGRHLLKGGAMMASTQLQQGLENITKEPEQTHWQHKPTNPLPLADLEIIVANCKDDISYLDRFESCEGIHFHVYSPCGGTIPNFTKVADCVTIHDKGPDCGRETYAYFDYMHRRYDSLPPMMAFLQGSAYTENPHIVGDVLHHMPGTSYSELSRVVMTFKASWLKPDKTRDDLMAKYAPSSAGRFEWETGWRSQFLASRDAILTVPREAFAEMNQVMCDEACPSEIQCSNEFWLAPMFGCDARFYQRSDCKVRRETIHYNLARPFGSLDNSKDPLRKGMVVLEASDTLELTCDDRTMLISKGSLNGLLTCFDHGANVENTPVWKNVMIN